MCSQHHQRVCPTSSHHAVPTQHGDGRGFAPAQRLPPRPRDLNITRGREERLHVSQTNMPAQHNTQQRKAEHRRRERSQPRGRGRNTRWQALRLHTRRINPHSGSHLYSFIGLWCPLNQSVKGWPDGASPAHPLRRGRGGERREEVILHAV